MEEMGERRKRRSASLGFPERKNLYAARHFVLRLAVATHGEQQCTSSHILRYRSVPPLSKQRAVSYSEANLCHVMYEHSNDDGDHAAHACDYAFCFRLDQ